MDKAKIALIVGIIAISIFPVLVKLELVPGISTAFYRMSISAAVLTPYVLISKKFKLPSKKFIGLSILSGIIFGTDIAIWNISIVESTATQATLLANLAPIWVGLGMFFFLADKPKRNFWIGTVIAFIGLIILIGLDVFKTLSIDRAFLLAILSGILYAHYILISKYVLRHVDILSFMSLMLLSSSVFLAIVTYFSDQPFTGFSSAGWGVLAVQAIVCQLIAWLALSYATQRMRATRVSVSLLSQGFLSALLAWIFLSEDINLQMIIGGVILLIGIRVTFIEKKLV